MSTEEDHLLDHSYDGIQEYDNPLPGWWVWLFWASIIYSGGYFLYYHVGIGPSIHDEYQVAAADAFEKQAAEFAKIVITEEVLADLQSNTALMDGMGQKFRTKCSTCHGSQGEGLACPNLTDEYFKNGATLVEIYETIRDGVPGTEMKAWKDDLGPAGLAAMSAYVGTLRGKNLPGRKAEGEKVVLPK